jgi:Tfp pilus assembly ATPase PilU
VIVGVVARTAPRALDILLTSGGSHRALAGVFKAGCSWRRVRDVDGRLKVIGDVLVSTARVNALIEEGDIAGLHRLQDNREEGMRSLDAALAAAVARRTVRLREAAASSVDRKALMSLVRRRRRESRPAVRTSRRSAAV